MHGVGTGDSNVVSAFKAKLYDCRFCATCCFGSHNGAGVEERGLRSETRRWSESEGRGRAMATYDSRGDAKRRLMAANRVWICDLSSIAELAASQVKPPRRCNRPTAIR